ncbi:MAG: glycosyltransferase [Rhodocyclaceae bacterium]|nr:glycosyltransferase [Rhodocyclaceae bacterium]MDZ4214767.1 glycosyltransferase [Rhodocyclaceae bacterium]
MKRRFSSPPSCHIIVPVYRDVEVTRRCLDTLSKSALPSGTVVTLIDDASPDPGMSQLLLEFSCLPDWTVHQHQTNLGFVVSANEGLALHPTRDVVLLNSDTEVPANWLQRLREAAYTADDIGTVTPFTNSGSLASYPAPSIENPLPRGFSVQELDQLFHEANPPAPIDIPVGVGFCLYIRRDCFDEVGIFDEGAFGKGYGEENDFCLRATSRKWRHVLAPDCFIFHRGHASFGDEKSARVQTAYELLIQRHPCYPKLLENHFRNDPLLECRLRVDALRILHMRQRSPAVHDDDSVATAISLCFQLNQISDRLVSVCWIAPGEAFRLWFSVPEHCERLQAAVHSLGLAPFPNIPTACTSRSGTPVHNLDRVSLLALVTEHGRPVQGTWYAISQHAKEIILRFARNGNVKPVLRLISPTLRARVGVWLKGR